MVAIPGATAVTNTEPEEASTVAMVASDDVYDIRVDRVASATILPPNVAKMRAEL